MNVEVQEVEEDGFGFNEERQYPFSPQLQSQYCYLSPMEEHHRLMVELNRSIWVRPIHPYTLPSSDQLVQLLITRYGGAATNYSVSALKQGFLVGFPDWLIPEEPLLDANYWEQNHQLRVLPWQRISPSHYLPPSFQAIVTIHDFPVDFWHPVYFRQAISAMGVLVAIPGEVLRGDNKGQVKLLIDCVDPKLIPYKLIVGHGEEWSECRVSLQGRPEPREGEDPI